jgi:formylglycine-generating enzyme required for sulfatase activity
MQSCTPGGPGMTNCGAASESCCTSPEVTGGMYYRTYTNSGSGPTGQSDPATISTFRLDKYLVTVGRFKQFATAWSNGWLPPAGSGKHTHLNGGRGLTNSASAGSYEAGWSTSDNSQINPTTTNLMSGGNPTWNQGANLPINGVTWWEAYAFCIWDGGFLPSEAEWEYAAAGGSSEREYPWGSAAPGGPGCPGIGCAYAIYGAANYAPVGTATLGAGVWGHLDLAGELFEWNLDWYAPYAGPCTDCAYVAATSDKIQRGDHYYDSSVTAVSSRNQWAPTWRGNIGFRCARTP